jgi:hypothetical protein
MERAVLEAWVEDVNRLETDLISLITAPSQRALDQVQRGLARVQAPLTPAILIETTSSAYRLQVWQHRLGVIAQLLRHGESQLAQR